MAPTAAEIAEAIERLGITREEFAPRINTPLRTLNGWLYEGKRAPGCLRIAIAHTEEHIGDLP